MVRLQPPLKNTKQTKGTRTTVPKGDAYLFVDHIQTSKKIKIITKSDLPEDMKMGIETEFGVTLVEHKEQL